MRTGAYPNQPILRTSCEIFAIGGEADRTDVQVPLLGDGFVVERTAERASAHVENLGSAIASSGEPHTVLAEADTTHDALVVELVHEVDIKRLGNTRIIEREPVLAVLPVLSGHGSRIEVAWELFLGAHNGRGRSGCLLWWEVVAATGGRLVHRGRGRGAAIVVICRRTASDATAWGVLLVVLEALGLGEVEVAVAVVAPVAPVAALVLTPVRWLLLHGHGLQSAAIPARRRSNRPIWTIWTISDRD
jgi:hypothetical protein